VTDASGVTYSPHSRLTQLDGQRMTFVDRTGASRTIVSGTIVGADGRSSVVRKCLGFPDISSAKTCMAGVLLEDTELPFEGFGHVVLGGPGPALIYRIGPRQIRACLDVPLSQAKRRDKLNYLQESFGPVLPNELRPAFRSALLKRPVVWAANQLRPRTHYGRDHVWLVGDAVGCTHPMTAIGMTLGFRDGECLANQREPEAYGRQRASQSRVPELLANSLYAAFSRHDDAAVMIRKAIYQLWRNEATERDCTMELLCASDTSSWQFHRIYLKTAAMTLKPVMADILTSRQWQHPVSAAGRLHRQIFWCDGHILPRKHWSR